MLKCKGVMVMCIFLSLILPASCIEKEITVEKKEDKGEALKSESVSIAHILQGRETYRGKTVTVFGKVTTGMAFEFVNEQPYLLDDGSGEIWVITKGVMPKEGSEIKVVGEVMAPYQIKGRKYEIVVLESEREL